MLGHLLLQGLLAEGFEALAALGVSSYSSEGVVLCPQVGLSSIYTIYHTRPPPGFRK